MLERLVNVKRSLQDFDTQHAEPNTTPQRFDYRHHRFRETTDAEQLVAAKAAEPLASLAEGTDFERSRFSHLPRETKRPVHLKLFGSQSTYRISLLIFLYIKILCSLRPS